MRNFIIGFFLLISYIQLFAQDTLYFDDHFQKVVPKITSKIRVYILSKESSTIQDFDMNRICMEANISGLTDSQSMNEFVWYIRNGSAEFDHKFYFQNLRGEFIFKSDNGTVIKTFFNGNNLLFYSITDSTKGELLINGNGQYTFDSKMQGAYEHQIFKDSLLTDHFLVRSEKQDTIYNKYDKIAEPYGGLQVFFDDLLKTLKYPFLKQLAGEETKIYIRFIVDKDGLLTDFEALTPKVTRFEKKAINKLSKLPAWEPAEKNGLPVKTWFILPITFKLE